MSVTETLGTLDLAFQTRGIAEPIWKPSVHNDSGLILKGEPTDANVREEMFEDVEHFVGRLSLPTYIPRNPKLASLPIIVDF